MTKILIQSLAGKIRHTMIILFAVLGAAYGIKSKKYKARLQDYEMIVKNDMIVRDCLEKIRIKQDITLSQESR